MNRRQLLAAILPLAATASLAATAPTAAEAAPGPIDPRLTFRLRDFVLWRHEYTDPCLACGAVHAVYTHGCHPVAFSLDWDIPGPTVPATPDAVPVGIWDGQPCDERHSIGPHEHHEFQWVDA